MASKEKSKLPNLKICIDNEESESDDDNLSLTEDPEISIEEGEIDKGGAKPVTEENTEQSSPISERGDDDVQFNVYLNKLDPVVTDSNALPKRVYENKEGNFITGIDLTKQEEVQKLQERAKRFGIEYKPEPTVNVEEIYKSLGLQPEDLSRKNERGIRLEAIHMRGVNEMSTKDVFNYFQEFAPGGCEWIDDESCNIVWLDKLTAARAMLKLSTSYEEVMKKYGLKVPGKSKPAKEKMETESKTETREKQDKDEKTDEMQREEEKMEEDNDDLDLMEEVKTGEKENEEKKNRTDEPEKMEDEGIEEGEITDSDSEAEVQSKNQSAFNKIPWPPGKWRLGVPHKGRARYIFLRFATKADVKLPGAESRSKYYQKYGNPNYGGARGLLSRSMKRKLRNRREEDGLETFGVPDVAHSDRNQVSYEDDLFSDTITPVEIQEIDLYTKTEKKSEKKKKKPFSDEEDMERSGSGEENEFPEIERMDKDEDRESGSEVDEQELERLLGVKEKRPMMRMYADEVEEKQKANRQRQLVGALTIVADAKKKVKKVRDARQLISGIDLRSALKEKKMNRENSPETWARPRSPDTWKGSRSKSPDFERELGGGMNLKIVTPMRMTIDNDVMSEGEADNEAEVHSEEEEEETKEEEEVKEDSPEPEPVKVLKEVKRKKRGESPLGTKSKMDLVEKPKDVRSRLSKRVNDDGDNRASRRSPNNVRSRLSKRVSPKNNVRSRLSKRASLENVSPERSDTRRSRLRRSRSRDRFRSKFSRSRSRSPFNRMRSARMRRSRSPYRRRFNERTRSPLGGRLPPRRFNRSRSRSPLNRRPVRSNIRSRSPIQRRLNDRTRSGRDARSNVRGRDVRARLSRKSRSPTDTESESDEDIAPSRIKMTVEASSSDSSSSSSDSSSDNSDSSSNSSSSSSSGSSSDSSSSSSSDSESDSDASERSAIRNKKSQRKIDRTRAIDRNTTRKEHQSRKDNNVSRPGRRKQRPPVRAGSDDD